MEHKQQTINAYNKIAKDFSDSHFDTIYISEFAKFKNYLKGNKVLEIGCGTGRDAEMFVSNKFEYTGADASEGMIEQAKHRVPAANFLVLDFYDLKFADTSFDGFWAAASLLHVPKKDLPKILKEAFRVVVDNGVGFISLKEKTEFDEGMIEQEKLGISRYFAFYSEAEFKDIITKLGFKVLEVTRVIENDERKTVWLCFFVQK